MTEADEEVPFLDQPLAKATETRKLQKEEVCIVKISLEENQNQVIEKRISIVGSDSSSSSSTPKTYKPDLISIGPYYSKEPVAGTENSVKDKFQKSFFGQNEKLKEQCRETLMGLVKFVGSWYSKNIGLDGINGGQFELVEMLLLDGCFILEFFYKLNSSSPQDAFKGVDDAEVVETIKAFIRDDRKVVQTLTDLLFFESQFPFFILFELHKLKCRYSDAKELSGDHHHKNNNKDALLEKFMTLVKKHNGNTLQNEFKEWVKKHEDDASLKQVKKVLELVMEQKYETLQKKLVVLTRYDDAGALLNKLIKLVEEHELVQRLMVMVKKSFVDHVPKLTPLNVAAQEDRRPKHLLQLVHWLCTPRPPSKTNDEDDDTCGGGNTEQINTATELEQDGVRLKKIGKVYSGYCDDKEKPTRFNAEDATTLFDIDFSWGRLKIPCFKIEDSTEIFFRNMIAFEQQSALQSKYFTDFAWCMGQLIRSQNDVNLLRRRGIIVNLVATDEMVAKMFQKLGEGMVLSSTFSQVYAKVNLFGEQPWNIWVGKLGQDFYYSPWKLISAIVGGLLVSLGTAVSVKNLLK